MAPIVNGTSIDDLMPLLRGRSLKRVDDYTLVTDEGTFLRVVPNEGCGGCSSGEYSLDFLADPAVNAVITNVATSDESGPDGTDHTYRIFIYTDAQPGVNLELVRVTGDDGNGYYGTGFELYVSKDFADLADYSTMSQAEDA